MPMKFDAEGGGTNADGSTNTEYCSHCYKEGSFTDPDLTVEQMQELVNQKLTEVGAPAYVANAAIEGIPSLKRWGS